MTHTFRKEIDAVINSLRRHQIDFGKTDAKSSMVTRDVSKKKLFIDAFAPPKKEDIEAIRSGDRYLFYGTKGSGKTALLRYMMEFERLEGNSVKTIVFSEDISREEKKKISKNFDFDEESKPDIGDADDTRDMWRLYIVQKIAELLASDGRMFDYCSDAKKLNSIVSRVFDGNRINGLQKLFSGIRSGSLSFKGGVSDYAEIEAVLNWEKPEENTKISYSRFSDLVLKKIFEFKYPEDVKYIIYFDEINLSMVGHKQHRVDSVLIRDLIITIGYINRLFAEAQVPIYLYAAVRVEIAKALNISRNEIDKYLVDHGHHLKWHDGFNIERYPIFEIVHKRISAIEKIAYGEARGKNEIWEDYFSKDIYGVPPKKFLIEITWCNPRDIVNLFNLASKSSPAHQRYDTVVFADVIDKYSDVVWTERAEELNTEHSMSVVNGIKRFLSGWKRGFYMNEFEKRVLDLSDRDKLLMQIYKTVGVEQICKDLYHVGVLGQSEIVGRYTDDRGRVRLQTNQTWFYRDNKEFDPALHFIVHRALFSCLKLGSLRADDFGSEVRY